MNKLSALALVASLALAAPAFAQSPAQLRDNPFMNKVETPMETATQAVKPDSLKDSSAVHHSSKHMKKKKHTGTHHHHTSKKATAVKTDTTATPAKKTDMKKDMK